MRLRDLVHDTRRRFEAAGVPRDEAALDAELIARDLLGWDRATWLTRKDEDVSSLAVTRPASGDRPFAVAFEALVTRRAAREPMAYLRGRQEFYGRDFFVTPAVLIPRPETELVVDLALSALADDAARVADIGTGSGCLAVTLALERPRLQVVATDVSAPALAVAGRNAGRHGVSGRVALVETSYLDGVGGPFDVVVSNPPYVPLADAPGLQPEVRDHEPAAALFGGEDGLDHVAAITVRAAQALRPGGVLVFEIGVGQAAAAAALAEAAGLGGVAAHPDLAGVPRVIVARRPS
ncbi:MAG: peptide chain release factor N(5)-glutamine methyltransferase [Vicinamibacterales bacterium]